MAPQGFLFIQHQVATSGGSSGAPLLNARGEVVGVHAFGLTDLRNTFNGAIPINYAKPYFTKEARMTWEEWARAAGATAKPSPQSPSGAWKVTRFVASGISFRVPANAVIKYDTPSTAQMELGEPPFSSNMRFEVRFAPSDPRGPDDKGLQEYVKQWHKTTENNALRNLNPGSRIISSKLISGDGYIGFYISKVDGNTRVVFMDAEIFTKRTRYFFDGGCSQQCNGADCELILATVFESFQFPK